MTKEQFIAQVEAIQKPLRRFLLALCCGDSQQSDDIAQEAFIKAYLSCDTLSSPEKFNAWIFRIAYNSFLDAKRTLRHTVDYGEASALKSGERADGAFQYQDLYAALNRLAGKRADISSTFLSARLFDKRDCRDTDRLGRCSKTAPFARKESLARSA